MQSAVPGSSVVYLYGVVPAGQALPDRDGTPAGDVALPSLVAIADFLPAAEFSGAALEQRLKDVEWVANQARRHASLLGRAMEHGPVVPARLCTLFSSTEALRASLLRTEPQLRDALERLRGRREWGVKLYSDEARLRVRLLADEPAAAGAATVAPPSDGAAWMMRKRREAMLADQVLERAEAMATAVLDELAATCSEVRIRPTLPESTTGVAEPMILNVALLVDAGEEAALKAAVDDLSASLGDDGYALVLSGPWPPFSFADPEDSPG